MKYLYIIAVIAVLGGGIWFSLRVGEQPQSVTKIAYSAYDKPDDFQSALLANFREPMKNAPLLLLGVIPGKREDLLFWKAFLSQNTAKETAYEAIVIDPKLPFANEVFPNAVKLDLKNEIERFSAGANNAKAQGIRMAVIAPTIYTAQVILENPATLLKTNDSFQPLSLSLTTFPRALTEESDMPEACKIGDQNRDGTGSLGCVIQNRARPLYKTKPPTGKFEGLVDQLGERDFLIYWNQPR